MKRFYAQFEAWHWFVSEGLKHANPYLLMTAINKLVLLGCRLILTYNELLYPYHKWFLRVLADAPEKPPHLLALINALYLTPSAEQVERFYEAIVSFHDWGELPYGWPAQFLVDSELTWQQDKTVIDDW